MINPNFSYKNDEQYYPYFVCDNFIDNEIFKNLKNNFFKLISRVDHWDEEYGIQYSDNKKLSKPIYISWGKNYPDSFEQIIQLSDDLPFLKKFLYLFKTEQTYERLFKKKKKLKIYDINEKISIFDFITKINCRVSIKISRVQPGSGIAIHRDSSDKILAMLFYFGFNDNVKRECGGTQIYKLNNYDENKNIENHKANNLDHYFFSNKIFKKIADIDPIENRLFGFVRNENSWHGVEPYEANGINNLYRETLQINLVKHRNYGTSLKILKILKKFFLKFKMN